MDASGFRRLGAAAAIAAASFLASCGAGDPGSTSVRDTLLSAASFDWKLPDWVPLPKVPESNPMSDAKVELGRHLFHDRRLSGNGRQSCASCHQQKKAFTDGRARAIGSTGEEHPRNTQSLANVAFNTTLSWAHPGLTLLEDQLLIPLFSTHPVELGVNDNNRDEVLQRIRDLPLYRSLFAAAFPAADQPIDWGNIGRAIASFQRTIFSFNSKFDRVQQGLERYTESEARGARLFFAEKAECFHCHAGPNFNDQFVHAASRVIEKPFHNTGLYNIDGAGGFPFPNVGIIEFTGRPVDMGRFRAPSLRNVEKTAPYMHDGTVPTLEAVLDFYAAGGRVVTGDEADSFLAKFPGDGRRSPFKSSLIGNIDLSAQDKADLIAFLKTLTDDEFLTTERYANPFTD
jgi:cytochrome c peroxidase